ncbi:hypothetical protein CesoFtcFv8_006683 [Champsocephalus esox]|uniref:Uncharacterized protein n=1 Tax=Champsocephalus esox TaxID=159716 RepID=A0AAN8H7T0_9TELE|nr:hypothetical protein CesoFtcFv8_006683 [Champsocephalus esox]
MSGLLSGGCRGVAEASELQLPSEGRQQLPASHKGAGDEACPSFSHPMRKNDQKPPSPSRQQEHQLWVRCLLQGPGSERPAAFSDPQPAGCPALHGLFPSVEKEPLSSASPYQAEDGLEGLSDVCLTQGQRQRLRVSQKTRWTVRPGARGERGEQQPHLEG